MFQKMYLVLTRAEVMTTLYSGCHSTPDSDGTPKGPINSLKKPQGCFYILKLQWREASMALSDQLEHLFPSVPAFMKSDKKVPGSPVEDGTKETWVEDFLVSFILHVTHYATKPYLTTTSMCSEARRKRSRQTGSIGFIAILSSLVVSFPPPYNKLPHSLSQVTLTLETTLLTFV